MQMQDQEKRKSCGKDVEVQKMPSGVWKHVFLTGEPTQNYIQELNNVS